MLFTTLYGRLITHVRNRLQSGELTERSLARLTGISQPHLHNVLKGVRSLSAEYADQILAHLHISVDDLIAAAELGAARPKAALPGGGVVSGSSIYVPRLRGSVGPSQNLESTPYPGDLISIPHNLAGLVVDPVVVVLGYDPELFPHFLAGDQALVTRALISTLDHSSVYLVKTPRGTLARSLRLAGKRLYLITPHNAGEPRKWDFIPLGSSVHDAVIGQLVWVSRGLNSDAAIQPRPVSQQSAGLPGQ